MNIVTKISMLPVLSLCLAACGGSSGSMSDGPAQGTQEIGARLSAGETVSATEVSSVILDYGDDTTSPHTGDTMSFKVNDDGSAVAVINGVEHAFSADAAVTNDGNLDYYQVEDEVNDRYYTVWGSSDWLGTIISENGGYASIIGAQTNIASGTEDGGVNNRIYAVIGDRTAASDMPTSTTATYTGRARFDVFPNTGFEDNGTSRTRYRGDTTVNVDFAGTVSGSITNWTEQLSGSDTRTDVTGTLLMNETNIDGSTFAGTLQGSGFTDPDIVNGLGGGGAYSGGFYGPDANEVAGTMSVNTAGDDGISAIGYFDGNR